MLITWFADAPSGAFRIAAAVVKPNADVLAEIDGSRMPSGDMARIADVVLRTSSSIAVALTLRMRRGPVGIEYSDVVDRAISAMPSGDVGRLLVRGIPRRARCWSALCALRSRSRSAGDMTNCARGGSNDTGERGPAGDATGEMPGEIPGDMIGEIGPRDGERP